MANQHLDTPWTQDRVEELKRLWAAGYSATEIVAELKMGVSRSGVLGKVMRLGLPKRKTAEFKPGPPRPRPPRVRRAVFIRPFQPEPEPEPPKVPDPPAALHEPKSFKVPLLKLRDGQCRWPTHDNPFLFCGWRRVDGKPYCAYHQDKAFAKKRGS